MPLFGKGQNTAYFQQNVHYDIEVTLDDENHLLDGEMQLIYSNQSPDTLKGIYFHLWANAHQQRNTALEKQLTKFGDTDLYFADEADRGGFETISFSQVGDSLSFSSKPDEPDVVWVELTDPILPGAKTIIDIQFQLKIPKSFSRLGHVGQSYQITQWYPKPAVYDQHGWHPMPYLDLGEFYSEFGSFDVKITLPANYWLTATGTLETPDEAARLDSLVSATEEWLETYEAGKSVWTDIESDTFPTSAQNLKTLRYTAENVHDFAWFADKRFWALKDTTQIEGRTVDCWAFFTKTEAELWKKAPFYLKRSLHFYSEAVGPYPYDQVTAAQSPLSKGGGMEYPMITLIGLEWSGRSLDATITHEVGHNWFYGILGSNERTHAWMDEGMNSYFDQAYMDQYYETPPLWFMPGFFRPDSPTNEWELSYLYKARRGTDQAPETHANDFTYSNYWLGAYEKPAWAMNMLREYLGEASFDQLMHIYFDQWRFKHPGPEDFLNLIERQCECDADWWLEGIIRTTDFYDYQLKSTNRTIDSVEVVLRNKGSIEGPIPLAWQAEDSTYSTFWVAGFEGEKSFTFVRPEAADLIIDPNHIAPDIDRTDNGTKGRFLPKLKFLTGLEEDGKKPLYWLPIAAWNAHDKFMVGLGLHNLGILDRPLKWALLPLYAIEEGQLNGVAYLGMTHFDESNRSNWFKWEFELRRFSDKNFGAFGVQTRYLRLNPRFSLRRQQGQVTTRHHTFATQVIGLRLEDLVFSPEGDFTGLEENYSFIPELSYHLVEQRTINPFSLMLRTEFQQLADGPFGNDPFAYLRFSADWRNQFTYKPDKHIYFRAFFGGMLFNTDRDAGAILPGAFHLTGQGFPGYSDYRYEDFYFGRDGGEAPFNQQIYQRDAGFKNAFDNAFRNQAGNTNDWMLAFNLKVDVPFNLPIRPYFDVAYVNDRQPLSAGKDFVDQIWWSGGIAVEYGDGWLGVYFPLINSNNINSLYDQGGGGYLSRVTFTIDFDQFRPDIIKRRLNY